MLKRKIIIKNNKKDVKFYHMSPLCDLDEGVVHIYQFGKTVIKPDCLVFIILLMVSKQLHRNQAKTFWLIFIIS